MKKSDNQLISEIKEGLNLSENQQELSKRHSGLFVSIINRYSPKRSPEKRIDLLEDKEYYIFMSIIEFNSTKKTKFSTFLGNKMKWLCINDYHKQNRRKTEPVPHEYLEINSEPLEDSGIELRSGLQSLIEIIKRDPDPRLTRIFQLRYLEGKGNKLMPWRDVCRDNNINLSIQGCINVHNKFIKKIKTKIKE
jgi:hypothetical protein